MEQTQIGGTDARAAIDPELARQLKVRAATVGRTMRSCFDDAVRDWLKAQKPKAAKS